jgi:hypothetical protein
VSTIIGLGLLCGGVVGLCGTGSNDAIPGSRVVCAGGACE